MKKHLNTLYVTTQGAYLNKEGETVAVNVDKETKLRLPIHTLDSIVCFGAVTMSPFLMHHCAENDVTVSLQKKEFNFKSRNRRPPLDKVNALLSFIYTLLVHDCRSALEASGLDPYVGYLHADRPGRPSFALDLMEEFRAYLADRLALSLINRRQISVKDFRKTESGAVLLNDDGRKKVLVAWQKRKQEKITHPFTQEKMETGLLSHMQAQLFNRYLRGDIDGYPPFLWK